MALDDDQPSLKPQELFFIDYIFYDVHEDQSASFSDGSKSPAPSLPSVFFLQ